MRYVIKNPIGAFYSDNKVVTVVPVPRADDPTRNDLVSKFQPLFEGMADRHALKFDNEADAGAAMSHPDLTDPAAFAGCNVVPALDA